MIQKKKKKKKSIAYFTNACEVRIQLQSLLGFAPPSFVWSFYNICSHLFHLMIFCFMIFQKWFLTLIMYTIVRYLSHLSIFSSIFLFLFILQMIWVSVIIDAMYWIFCLHHFFIVCSLLSDLFNIYKSGSFFRTFFLFSKFWKISSVIQQKWNTLDSIAW